MNQDVMPETKEELKKFIIQTMGEISDKISFVSDEEQKEIEEMYGDVLDEKYDRNDYEKLEDLRGANKKEGL